MEKKSMIKDAINEELRGRIKQRRLDLLKAKYCDLELDWLTHMTINEHKAADDVRAQMRLLEEVYANIETSTADSFDAICEQ